MNVFKMTVLLTWMICIACRTSPPPAHPGMSAKVAVVKVENLPLFDSARNRSIPVALYSPESANIAPHPKLVIFSHGYGANKGGSNQAYTYIAEHLVDKGYIVASIQHELPNDSLIPTTGIPQVVRRPFWERGTDNILFVLNSLKKLHPNWDYTHLILIGHSNGGDMTALFAAKYPNLVDKIITLDNRRMPLPRLTHPKIYSLRSSDQPADDGVIPTKEEQQLFGITIIQLPNTIHNDMDDKASSTQRSEINNYIDHFLQ
ncbi:hypothetical protein SAMN05518672_102750 [Chitinophaga sp. CF118]|uniref:alpha/beta hydrolase family protein n=1 Tax=Chitinophaga sp. CF118 TaxID=1884367 RepID=UPI0008EDA7D0|nr:alpha/beta fold hydrolase [Chitinophaga sp. CF118]SFD64161.1 hypothetical protein SAMN05518672_102750 [Chitinophaga sp. CF118]